MTPKARAASPPGSARIGKSAPSDSANFLLSSGVSVLTAKYATSYARIAWPPSLSDLHSLVQPPVNALGNQASTTLRPRSSDSLWVLPSEPTSENSGAAAPTSGGVAGADAGGSLLQPPAMSSKRTRGSARMRGFYPCPAPCHTRLGLAPLDGRPGA